MEKTSVFNPLDWGGLDPKPVLVLDSGAYAKTAGNVPPSIVLGTDADATPTFGTKVGSINLSSHHSYDDSGGSDYPYKSHTADTTKLSGSQYTGGAVVVGNQSHAYSYSSGDYHDDTGSGGTFTFVAVPVSGPPDGKGTAASSDYTGWLKETFTLDYKAGQNYGSTAATKGADSYASSDGLTIHMEGTKFDFGSISDAYNEGGKDAAGFANTVGIGADTSSVSDLLAVGASSGFTGLYHDLTGHGAATLDLGKG